jgi:hypothetical protein
VQIIRLADVLLDNLVRGTPESLLAISTRCVVAHYDLCQPHLHTLPQELQTMITHQQQQGVSLIFVTMRPYPMTNIACGENRQENGNES